MPSAIENAVHENSQEVHPSGPQHGSVSGPGSPSKRKLGKEEGDVGEQSPVPTSRRLDMAVAMDAGTAGGEGRPVPTSPAPAPAAPGAAPADAGAGGPASARPREDFASPVPLPPPVRDEAAGSSVAAPAEEPEAMAALTRLLKAHEVNERWAKEVDDVLVNHMMGITRCRSREFWLNEEILEGRLAQLELRAVEQQKAVQDLEGGVGEHAAKLHALLQDYTAALEQKLGLLESHSVAAGRLAQAARDGAIDPSGLSSALLHLQRSADDLKATLTAHEQTVTQQFRVVRAEVAHEFQDVRETLDAQSRVSPQAGETRTSLKRSGAPSKWHRSNNDHQVIYTKIICVFPTPVCGLLEPPRAI